MARRKKQLYSDSGLSASTIIPVRFNEVDALGIVWHGHYIMYFEQGREAFGLAHGIGYQSIQQAGYTTPIVQSSCEHKLPLRYGDSAKIVAHYVDTPAAKLIFRYAVYNDREELVCRGETVQVFLDRAQQLVLNLPDFVLDWKRKVGLL